MVDDYTLDKVLDKFKEIDIEKTDDIRILIDTDGKLPDDITLENVILMTCVMVFFTIIKNGDKFYPQHFFEETLYDE